MNLDDYVAVELLDGKTGMVVRKDYAAAYELKELPDEPVFAHGRIRSPFKLNGRPNKPKTVIPPAQKNPDDKTNGGPVGGTPGSVAVENNQESK